MKKIAFAVPVWLVLFCAGSATAQEEVHIENTFLTVTVRPNENHLEVYSNVGEQDMVREGSFFEEMTSASTRSVRENSFGQGKEVRVGLDDGSTVSLRLYAGHPFLHVHAHVHNPGEDPLSMRTLNLATFRMNLESQQVTSFGTGGVADPAAGKGSYDYQAFVDPETRNGIVSASLTHELSQGIFFPDEKNGQLQLKVNLDFGHYQVKPGRTRRTDTVVVGYFDDSLTGLEQYASAVAEVEQVNLKPKPNFYFTWYHDVNQEQLRKNLEFMRKHLKPYGLDIAQIDAKWHHPIPKGASYTREDVENVDGSQPKKVFTRANDTLPNKFPDGMNHVADMISSRSFTAGIWVTPFSGNFKNPYFDEEIFPENPDGSVFRSHWWGGNSIDLTTNRGQEFVRERIRRFHDWGYRYLKLDALPVGLSVKLTPDLQAFRWYTDADQFGRARLDDPYMTHVQAFRKGLDIVRDAAPGAFLMGCNLEQSLRALGPAFGKVDSMRIGRDSGGPWVQSWSDEKLMSQVTLAARVGANRFFLNGRVWHNDPDAFFVREGVKQHHARWTANLVAVSGMTNSTAEFYYKLPEERLDLIKRTLPAHNYPARPIDLFETKQPRIWHVSNDRMHVVGLFNWHLNDPERINYDLEKIGLEPDKKYIGFDYWNDRLVGSFKGKLKQKLKPEHSRVLALRTEKEHPQLISTSRHITQGLMDVHEEVWNPERKALLGTSKVVPGDPYEMRVVLPSESDLQLEEVRAEHARITPVKSKQARIVRVKIHEASRKHIDWQLTFERK